MTPRSQKNLSPSPDVPSREADVKVSCAVCSFGFEAKRSDAKYCGERCRKRAQRETRLTKPKRSSRGLVEAVRSDLDAHNVLDTPAGEQALAMAERMVSAVKDTGSSFAAISRELSRLRDEALAGASRKADPLDELAKRREDKAAVA
jgi:hypothetical protein